MRYEISTGTLSIQTGNDHIGYSLLSKKKCDQMKHGMKLLLVMLWIASPAHTQVAINSGSIPADPSAMLDVKSTLRGLLLPRMTAGERDDIVSPASGLLIFCTDNQMFYCNQGTPSAKSWVMVNSPWRVSGRFMISIGCKFVILIL